MVTALKEGTLIFKCSSCPLQNGYLACLLSAQEKGLKSFFGHISFCLSGEKTFTEMEIALQLHLCVIQCS